MEKIDIEKGKKLRRIPKMTWMKVVRKDMKLLQLEKRIVTDRNDWKRKLCTGSNINFFLSWFI